MNDVNSNQNFEERVAKIVAQEETLIQKVYEITVDRDRCETLADRCGKQLHELFKRYL